MTSKIQIISHRGLWEKKEEKNTEVAFRRAFSNGFGIETDLRDSNGDIVISHNMLKPDEKLLTLEQLLEIMNEMNCQYLPLALNIKADGLGEELLRLLIKYKHTNYFTFDMSLPELVCQAKLGIRFFAGISDLQPNLPNENFLNTAIHGVWMDTFGNYSSGYALNATSFLLQEGKEVCIVSPELHDQESQRVPMWRLIKQKLPVDCLSLCTDKPLEAREFFSHED